MTLKDTLKNPIKILFGLGMRGWFRLLSDEAYLGIMYYSSFGKTLNLKEPKTFNEKLQWLKINDRKTEYTKMVDKHDAKLYVASCIGEEYVIPTLGCWDNFNDIDFDALPNEFVLKCTHDSGGISICRGKESWNRGAAKKKIEASLRRNYFTPTREYPYKDVKPRIIAEQYMNDGNAGLRDYKFFCFNGIPKFIYISEGLEDHSTAKISFFDFAGHQLPFRRKDFAPFDGDVELPDTFDKMRVLSKELAEKIGCPFVRIDFYSINGKIYFSEITFFPCSGFLPFEPAEWDCAIGEMMEIPLNDLREG